MKSLLWVLLGVGLGVGISYGIYAKKEKPKITELEEKIRKVQDIVCETPPTEKKAGREHLR